MKSAITTAIQAFASQPLREASLSLLSTLGYQSDKTLPIDGADPQAFLSLLQQQGLADAFNQEKSLFTDWTSADLLFQLTDDEISGDTQLFEDHEIKPQANDHSAMTNSTVVSPTCCVTKTDSNPRTPLSSFWKPTLPSSTVVSLNVSTPTTLPKKVPKAAPCAYLKTAFPIIRKTPSTSPTSSSSAKNAASISPALRPTVLPARKAKKSVVSSTSSTATNSPS